MGLRIRAITAGRRISQPRARGVSLRTTAVSRICIHSAAGVGDGGELRLLPLQRVGGLLGRQTEGAEGSSAGVGDGWERRRSLPGTEGSAAGADRGRRGAPPELGTESSGAGPTTPQRTEGCGGAARWRDAEWRRDGDMRREPWPPETGEMKTGH